MNIFRNKYVSDNGNDLKKNHAMDWNIEKLVSDKILLRNKFAVLRLFIIKFD